MVHKPGRMVRHSEQCGPRAELETIDFGPQCIFSKVSHHPTSSHDGRRYFDIGKMSDCDNEEWCHIKCPAQRDESLQRSITDLVGMQGHFAIIYL